MKTFFCRCGREIIVDDDCFSLLSASKWGCVPPFYLSIHRKVRGKLILLTNCIMGTPPLGTVWDHRDLDGHNNQRENLRAANHSQNNANRSRFKNNTSGYKGVYLQTNGRWRATIQLNGNPIHLGYFDDKETAAAAYNEKAALVFGEFARPNPL